MALTDIVRSYAQSFDARVAEVLRPAAEEVPALRERLAAAGISAEELTDVDALERIPVLTKDELIDVQASSRPFGGLLTAGADVRRVFQSPGPLYEAELREPDPWRWAPALEAAGFGAADSVLNAAGYHLTPLGAMFEEAVFVLGGTVLPGGVGNLDLQVQACADLGVTAYVGLPSYLKALLEKADELGVAGSLRLERAFVAAEPLPPSLRSWLEERVPVVRQGYGTAEAGNLGYECERKHGFHVPDDALVQVCDLTSGRALWQGEEGQVVATLFRKDYPLVRLGTGDLSAFLTEPCECGRPTPRLVGWLGRVGEAVKVRGMFLHPRQIRAVMADVAGVARYRFVVGRREHVDELRCEIERAEGAPAVATLAEAVRERVRSALRFRVEVVPVDSLDADTPVLVDEREWE
jgi:phenylacetate-coenzyme A ligase PaaK-like adenylate-forming protein